MKNPNGYGTVVKLSGNRRRPYTARITVGFNEKGHAISKTLGYYATKAEGLIALAEYNKNPYDVDTVKITLKEVYEKWSKREFPKMPKSSVTVNQSTYNTYISSLADKPYKEIKAYQMQEIIDNCGHGYSTQRQIKNLFAALDKYALELDVIVKSNAQLLTTATAAPKERTPFAASEIQRAWRLHELKLDPQSDTLLFLLYTGYRINEMLNAKIENIDFELMLVKGGSKTKAGKSRVVPIHPKIQDIVLRRAEGKAKSDYLFTLQDCNAKIPQSRYYRFWDTLMNEIDAKHTPHECRHTFQTELYNAGADKRSIDLLMGHSSGDVGLDVYTHKSVDDLKNAISLIPY